MISISAAQWGFLLLMSACVATIALWIDGKFMSRRSEAAGPQAKDQDSHFLFDADDLVDHDVIDLLPGMTFSETVKTWSDLHDWLSGRFDGLPVSLADLPQTYHAQFTTQGADSRSVLDIRHSGARTHLTLSDSSTHSAGAWHSVLMEGRIESSAGAILAAAPDPIWRTNARDEVIWRNEACARILDQDGGLPTMSALPDPSKPDVPSVISIEGTKEDGNRWFELRSFKQGDDRIHFASDITQVIKAETVQRDFVQTLTKTFANLTIGLAIFDRERRLALFNPALVDLTSLPVTFLSGQPDMMHFFDELREKQVMPEPKNYADWRAQIRDVVAQANDGIYQQMWTLPNSLTYRVTGRPHPNGAIAFLFEDISAEVSLTRRFRTQIELRQSVLDGINESVAVIGPNNLVIFCNKPCGALLRVDPDSSFADMSVRDLLGVCAARFDRSPSWEVFEQALSAPSQEEFTATLSLDQGQKVICRLKPLPGGARMLRFLLETEGADQFRLSAAS